MSAALHGGLQAPVLEERMEPDDEEIFFVSWAGKLFSDESLVTSEWVLPPEFRETGAAFNEINTCECVDYPSTNVLRMITYAVSGRFLIQNTVTTTRDRTLTRGFFVVVASDL